MCHCLLDAFSHGRGRGPLLVGLGWVYPNPPAVAELVLELLALLMQVGPGRPERVHEVLRHPQVVEHLVGELSRGVAEHLQVIP